MPVRRWTEPAAPIVVATEVAKTCAGSRTGNSAGAVSCLWVRKVPRGAEGPSLLWRPAGPSMTLLMDFITDLERGSTPAASMHRHTPTPSSTERTERPRSRRPSHAPHVDRHRTAAPEMKYLLLLPAPVLSPVDDDQGARAHHQRPAGTCRGGSGDAIDDGLGCHYIMVVTRSRCIALDGGSCEERHEQTDPRAELRNCPARVRRSACCNARRSVSSRAAVEDDR